ncbi:AAA family ATPase [Pseudomonas sp. B33.4]|uniref:AAA family ATPase n=1 Tax=Pseudomonas sp. B33.4 TaxID=3104265 RepID=UPI002ADEFB6F|nr:AAA family ATPase [Pseudomonas sp. B33.4]
MQEQRKSKLQVVFSLEVLEPKIGQVVIVPADTSWNDFGHRIRCTFQASLNAQSPVVSGDMFIGFLPSPGEPEDEFFKRRLSLFEIIESNGLSAIVSDDAPTFFTLLPDLKGYRYIVERLGPKDADFFLKSVMDLVASKGGKNEWVEKALATDVFKLGFMRNSEPFFAFNNADSVLGGLASEDFTAISKSLNLSFRMEGAELPYSLDLRFSNQDIIPRRINILIGKNGLGKSQTLKNFCRAALQYKDEGLKLTDHDSRDGRPMISRVLAIATPGETRNTFPPERKKDQKLFYRRLNLTRGGKSSVTRSIGDALVRLARNEEFIGENSRWSLFVGALEKSLPIDSIVIPLQGGEFASLVGFVSGGEQRCLERWASVESNVEVGLKISGVVFPLSSGQLTFFKLTLLCCLYIENGSYVLMDEPETHLHPNLISELVDILDYLLEQTGSHAIIATHSAYFVREVSKEQVHVFHQVSNGLVEIDQPRLRTFGATVDSISQFVFGEDVEIRLIDKLYERIKDRSFQDVDKELGDQLSLAALMDIRRRMEANS